MNRSQEENILNAFKNLYSEFPPGACIHGEQPDYVIISNNRSIGIEITQIFIDNHLDSVFNLKRTENLQRQLGENLCTELSKFLPFKFILLIDFSTVKFSTNKISKITSDCIAYLKDLRLTGKESYQIEIDNHGQMLDEIESIRLCQYHNMLESSYSEIAGDVLPLLTMKNLKAVLEKKEQALNKYRECHEHWLLIAEGNYRSDSYSDVSVGVVATTFDKVFLYRHAHGEILVLK